MQVTIAKQLGLEPTTVGNFFMNARRRSMDKWKDEDGNGGPKSPGASSNGGGSVRYIFRLPLTPLPFPSSQSRCNFPTTK